MCGQRVVAVVSIQLPIVVQHPAAAAPLTTAVVHLHSGAWDRAARRA
jgi:hypothetical protein